MTTLRTIAATETNPNAPLISALFKALAANLLAAFEGDATAVAAGVQLQDAALDSGAATAAGRTWVALRTAGLAVGAVGTYAFLRLTSFSAQAPGATIAGSSLRYTNAGASTNGGPSGTWRLMGSVENTLAESPSLWLRIS